jgi:hypothetical protein
MGKARKSQRLIDRYPHLCFLHIPHLRLDFYTVKLRDCDDYPHGDVIMAEVEGEHVHEWADSDGYLGGDSWETPSDMPGFAYAMPCNHAGLVAELEAEGYVLDLSEYNEPIDNCRDADCHDPECPWPRVPKGETLPLEGVR